MSKKPLLCGDVGRTRVSALPKNETSVGRTLLSGLLQHSLKARGTKLGEMGISLPAQDLVKDGNRILDVVIVHVAVGDRADACGAKRGQEQATILQLIEDLFR